MAEAVPLSHSRLNVGGGLARLLRLVGIQGVVRVVAVRILVLFVVRVYLGLCNTETLRMME